MTGRLLGNGIALGAGAVFVRLCQFAVALLLADALGAAGFGTFAAGCAVAAVLAMLAGAGVRNHVARAVAQDPAQAGALLRAACRARLLLSLCLLLPYSALVAVLADEPGPWWWFGLLAVPQAFDLKNLLDAVSRGGREVAIESTAAIAQVGVLACYLQNGGRDLATIAAITVVSRVIYALLAAATIRRLPVRGSPVRARELLRHSRRIGVAQTACELATCGDVWLIWWLGGSSLAGVYSLAQRLCAAAALPSLQLSRFLLPHIHRSGNGGDVMQVTRVALRGTAYALLPVAAGGMVVAEPLCALFGPEFAGASAAALRWLLGATIAQHLAWQLGQALLARHRDRAFATSMWVCAGAQSGLLVLAAPLGLAAIAVAAAQGAYLLVSLLAVRRDGPLQLMTALQPTIVPALATACASALPGCFGSGPWMLAAQLLAGATTFAWFLFQRELRGRGAVLGARLASRRETPDRPAKEPAPKCRYQGPMGLLSRLKLGTRVRLLLRGIRYAAILPYTSIDGWLSVDEAIKLFELARAVPERNPVAVEIGSWQGKSSVVLAKGLLGKQNPTLYCVDPFDASGEQGSAGAYQQRVRTFDTPLRQGFLHNLQNAGVRDMVEILQGLSHEVAPTFERPIDLLFLDGDHSFEGVRRDFDDWARHLRPGGWLCLHDVVHPEHDGPRRLVDEVIRRDARFGNVQYVDSMFVAQRLAEF